MFNQVLPYYLAIGMPYELFWSGDPDLVKTYRSVHQMRMQQKNQEMWAQGIYVHRAFMSVAEKIMQGFSGGKGGGNTTEYPSEPIPFTEEEQKAQKARNIKRTLAWVENNQH